MIPLSVACRPRPLAPPLPPHAGEIVRRPLRPWRRYAADPRRIARRRRRRPARLSRRPIIPGTKLEPYVFGALNSRATRITPPPVFRGNLATASTSGPVSASRSTTARPRTSNTSGDDDIEFGSRILFEPEVGIGARRQRAADDRGELGPPQPCHIVQRTEPRHRQYRRAAELPAVAHRDYQRPSIFSGLTTRSNVSSSTRPSSSPASFSVRPFLWACLAIAAALS